MGRLLEAFSRIPLWVRFAVGVLAAAAVIAGTLARDQGRGDEPTPSRSGSTAAEHPAYLGPKHGRDWMPPRATPSSVVWAVGDAADGGSASRAVAEMVSSRRVDRLLYLGDVYETGTAAEFESNYRPLYGRFDSITAPTIGNHEWPNIAIGYVPYWTAAHGRPPPLRYAFAVSGWQLISLNSNLPTDPEQEAWLRSELERTPRYGNCRIAFMHHPRYSAGLHGDLTALQDVFDELQGHATIALAGHDHDMQRLRPIDGITPYVDGSGGRELYPVNRDDPRLAFFDETDHGALRIGLAPGHATLTFVDQSGAPLDRSTVSCRQS